MNRTPSSRRALLLTLFCAFALLSSACEEATTSQADAKIADQTTGDGGLDLATDGQAPALDASFDLGADLAAIDAAAKNDAISDSTTSNDLAVVDTISAADAAAPPSSSWHWLLSGPGDDIAYAAARTTGATYLGAYYEKTITLGTQSHSAGPVGGAVLFKLSDSGTVLWSRDFAGTGYAFIRSVASDSNGDITVGGLFTHTINLGGGTITAIGGSSGEAYVARFASAGKHLWSRRLSSGPLVSWLTSEVTAIVQDKSGNSYATGYFTGEIDLGNGSVKAQGNGSDIFIAKYDSAGKLLFGKVFPCDRQARAHGIALDSAGNIVIVGELSGTIDFGGTKQLGYGGSDALIAKLDPKGNHLYSARFGGNDIARANKVAIDGNDNIIVVGTFVGTLSFGGKTLFRQYGDDLFLASFDSKGAHRFSSGYGGTNYEVGSAVAVDSAGDIYLLGRFSSAANFGTGILTPASQLSMDLVIGKYAGSDGHPLWTMRLGGPGQDTAGGVIAASDLWVYGGISNGASLGGSPITVKGGSDLFLARFPRN